MNFKNDWIAQQLKRIARTVATFMHSIDARFMRSRLEIGQWKPVTVPLVPGPSGNLNIRPRKLSDLGRKESVVDKELNFDSFPGRSTIDCPAGDRVVVRHGFSPTVKCWRKHIDKRNNSDGANYQDLNDSFTDKNVG